MVKLDMAKAYNLVEWSYLRAIMVKLRLVEGWINTIMRFVQTVSFFVWGNGVYSQYAFDKGGPLFFDLRKGSLLYVEKSGSLLRRFSL